MPKERTFRVSFEIKGEWLWDAQNDVFNETPLIKTTLEDALREELPEHIDAKVSNITVEEVK